MARRTLDAFDVERLDAVITNAAGCGTHLKNYGHLLQDDPAFAERAMKWSAKVRDIHEWLAETRSRASGAACLDASFGASANALLRYRS